MLKKKIINISIWLLVALSVLAGLWFRIVNLNHTGFFFDTVTTQYEWGKMIFQNGVLQTWFSFSGYIDYPPLNWLYLSVMYGISTWFGGSALAFVTTLKVWYIICDVLLLVLLYVIFSRFQVEWWKKACVLSAVFLYPGFWFVSGVWGQSDTFHTLLILASILLLYEKKYWQWIVGGVLFALAFWFKLQVILVAFALVVVWFSAYRSQLWMQWKQMLVGAIPFVLAAGLGIYHVSVVYGKFLGANQSLSHKDFFDSGTFLASVAITLVFVYFTFSFFQLSRFQNQWKHIHVFLTTFFGISSVITLIFASLNPLQWYRTIWEPLGVGRGGNFTGAANLNNVILRWNDFHPLGEWLSVLKIGSSILFIVLVVWIIRRIYLRAQNTLFTTLVTLCSIVLVYYVFSTGRVHSRYGHSALILLFILMPLVRFTWIQWIGAFGLLLLYTVNQVSVYASFANNFRTDFIQWLAVQPVFNNYWLTVGLMVGSALLFLPGLIGKKNPLAVENK